MSQFLNFTGRRGVLSHFLFSAMCTGIVAIVVFADPAAMFGAPSTLARVATAATLIAAVVPAQIAATAQRCRDVSLSGWWAALLLFPPLGLPLWAWLLVVPGKPRLNRYGPPPGESGAVYGRTAW